VQLGWIWTDNLRPVLEQASLLLGYSFDDSDWTAVDFGLSGTDSEQGPWFDYPVGPSTLHVALEPGASEMVQVLLDGVPKRVAARLEWTSSLMRDYHVRPSH
jgi:hypothetical protein